MDPRVNLHPRLDPTSYVAQHPATPKYHPLATTSLTKESVKTGRVVVGNVSFDMPPAVPRSDREKKQSFRLKATLLLGCWTGMFTYIFYHVIYHNLPYDLP